MGVGNTWQYGSSSNSFNASVGNHTYEARQIDLAGNESPAVSDTEHTRLENVNYDNSEPDAPTFSLATDSGASSTDFITNVDTINAGGLESSRTSWGYKIGNGAWQTVTGNDTSFTTDTEGEIEYQLRQTDIAGNLSEVTTRTTPPNTPNTCLLYTSPSPRDRTRSRMPSSA